MGVCFRYAHHEEEAMDIFQEAFVKIFLKMSDVKDVVAMPAWIKRVAVTTAINHYHRNKRFRDSLEIDEALDAEGEDYELILQQTDNETLLELINELPPGYKVIFNMYVIEGFNHPEIADLLKISENTSKSQLSRARELLRKSLKKKGIKSLTNYA